LVGSLCVVAVMLLTYMSGQAKPADLIAGIALLGVVFFPTNRGEDLRHADPETVRSAYRARTGLLR
jgi:hypothetical protein